MGEKQAKHHGFVPEPPGTSTAGHEELTGDPEATRQEEREATERTPGPAHGHRGDQGDSGPGED